MMGAFETNHSTRELLSAEDIRAAFQVPPTRPDIPGIHALAALATFWDSCLTAEATGAINAAVAPFNYPPTYESVFDGVSDGVAVAFINLPIGLQRLIGGRATDIWYAFGACTTPVTLVSEIQTLTRSWWIRRTVRIRDLAPCVLTPWGVTHAWPCGADGAAGFGLPPTEYTGGYTALISRGQFNAPVIFLNGEIHRHAVGYLLALLRFVPDATVRVLEGVTRPSGESALPVAPHREWPAEGGPGDEWLMPRDGDPVFTTAGRVDRWVLKGHADLIVSAWAGFGMSLTETPHDLAVQALQEATFAARLPYVDADVAMATPAAERRSWRPLGDTDGSRDHRAPWISRLRRWLLHLQPEYRVANRVLPNRTDQARRGTSLLGSYVPELGGLVQ